MTLLKQRLANISIPILAKITVPYVFLAGLVALGGTFLVTSVVFDSVEERFTNQLIEVGLLSSEAMVRAEEDLLENLRIISFLGGLDAAVSEDEAGQVLQLILPAAYSTGVDAFAVLDETGSILVARRFVEDGQVYEGLANTDPLRSHDFVMRVLRGESDETGDKFAGFVRVDEGDYLFVAGPIDDSAGDQVGVAMVGLTVQDLITTIREETLAQITFYSLDGVPLYSTFQTPSPIEVDQAAVIVEQQDEGSLVREVEDSAIDYRELLSTWEVRGGQDVGIVGVSLATSFITDATQITRASTLLLVGVTMLLVVLVGVFVAGRITRPIHALRDAALKVAAGNLQIKVPPRSRDEVGVLTVSFNEMVDNLSQAKQDQLDTYNRTIEGWSRALDLRDHETEGHSQRVAELTLKLARQMGIDGEELEHVHRGALLHDIGKIAIPDSVLLKPGQLTKKERELIERHPVYAKGLLEEVEFLQPALDIPYSHHERWDGRGYPQGLAGEEIPLAARVFTVVDVWDALTSNRPYRKAMTHAEALELIEQGSGTQFDPEVVSEFLIILEDASDETQGGLDGDEADSAAEASAKEEELSGSEEEME